MVHANALSKWLIVAICVLCLPGGCGASDDTPHVATPSAESSGANETEPKAANKSKPAGNRADQIPAGDEFWSLEKAALKESENICGLKDSDPPNYYYEEITGAGTLGIKAPEKHRLIVVEFSLTALKSDPECFEKLIECRKPIAKKIPIFGKLMLLGLETKEKRAEYGYTGEYRMFDMAAVKLVLADGRKLSPLWITGRYDQALVAAGRGLTSAGGQTKPPWCAGYRTAFRGENSFTALLESSKPTNVGCLIAIPTAASLDGATIQIGNGRPVKVRTK